MAGLFYAERLINELTVFDRFWGVVLQMALQVLGQQRPSPETDAPWSVYRCARTRPTPIWQVVHNQPNRP
jgi:hypothetical protein